MQIEFKLDGSLKGLRFLLLLCHFKINFPALFETFDKANQKNVSRCEFGVHSNCQMFLRMLGKWSKRGKLDRDWCHFLPNTLYIID